MDQELLELLKRVDTPTVCNAIEVVEGKRGFNGFTRGTMLCSAPEGGAMVGYASTAKIAALEPPTEPADVIRARRMEYYRRMAEAPKPSIAVIEDVDYPALHRGLLGRGEYFDPQGLRHVRCPHQRGHARPRRYGRRISGRRGFHRAPATGSCMFASWARLSASLG